jgi:TPR repeat protein
MGRRDEPKLDELHRLLRRLEYMEVDKSPEPSQRASSDTAKQGPGYVGALRGAPTIESSPTRHSTKDEPEAIDFMEQSEKPRSSSTASVVIGATTAAVVSSVVVVGLLLWMQGKEGGSAGKSAEQQRLNFVAPVDRDERPLTRSPAVIESAVPSDPEPPADTQSLLQRADLYIRNGRLSEARELLEQAAKLGSGVAALTLGAMYDPTRVAQFGNLGVQADPTLARAWYERAKDLGVVEANDRLSELARK